MEGLLLDEDGGGGGSSHCSSSQILPATEIQAPGALHLGLLEGECDPVKLRPCAFEESEGGDRV